MECKLFVSDIPLLLRDICSGVTFANFMMYLERKKKHTSESAKRKYTKNKWKTVHAFYIKTLQMKKKKMHKKTGIQIIPS